MKRSTVWRYFEQDEECDPSKASCSICGEVFSHSNNTSKYKMANAEREEQQSQSKQSTNKKAKTQMTIQSSIERKIPYSTSCERARSITESLIGMIAKVK